MPFTRSSQYSLRDIFNQLFNPDTNKLTVDTTLGERIAGEDLVNDVQKVEQRFQYVNLSAGATTVVKTGAGVLHAIVVNKHVASGSIIGYDNTAASGSKLFTITAGATILNDPPVSAPYDLAFTTGLTLVLTNTQDVTVIYR